MATGSGVRRCAWGIGALLCVTAAGAQELKVDRDAWAGGAVRIVAPPRPMPPRPPEIVLPPGARQRGEQPIKITKAVVDIGIAGPVARTAVTVTFHNPNGRVLEGELVFPLPEGATVSGYGLDVGADMVDAVPVPRVQARRVFEEEVRRNPTIDPGLVEKIQGNVFRTRVHPLPARGVRHVKIEWIAPLTLSADGLDGIVPLAWGLTVPDVEIKLKVSTAPEAGAALTGAAFGPADFAWTATKTLKDFTLDGGVACRLPTRAAALRTVEDWRDEDGLTVGHYFAVTVDAGDLFGRSPGLVAERRWSRVGVAWDASLSRLAPEARKREIELLKKLLAKTGADGVAVDLIVFRDTADAAVAFASAPGAAQGDALAKALDAVVYDGATDFSPLALPATAADGRNYDAWLVFTDGMATLNGAEPTFPANTFLFSRADKADHDALAYFARRAGGRYFNLDTADDDMVVNALTFDREPLRIHAIQSDVGAVADVYPPAGTPFGAATTLVLTGRLNADATTLRVTVADGAAVDGNIRVLEFPLAKKDAAAGGIVARLWAQRKVADLSPRAEANADELARLGRDFRLVTPNMSLLILENLDQHLRHDIAPARSRTALYQQFMAHRAKRTDAVAADTASRLQAVRALWDQKVRWYDTDFKAAIPHTQPVPAEDAILPPGAATGSGLVASPPVAVARPVPSGGVEFRDENARLVDAAAPDLAATGDAVPASTAVPLPNPPVVASGPVASPALPAGGVPAPVMTAPARPQAEVAGRFEADRAELGRSMAADAPAPAEYAARARDGARRDALDADDREEEPADDMAKELAEEARPSSRRGVAGLRRAAEAAPDASANARRADDRLSTVAAPDMAAGGGKAALTWQPENAPYVAILRAAPEDKLYDAYLISRPGFIRTPGFFLDCAGLFAERGRADLAARVLGNVLELDLGSIPLMRAVAHKYAQLGRADRAAALFRRILAERPDEPQSRRDLALALADRAEFDTAAPADDARAWRREAVDLLHHVVMHGPYGRFDQIETIALMEANRLVARFAMADDKAFTNPFDETLRRNLDCDVRMVLTWDADDTDIDFWVTEPTGERCGYSQPLTKSGGRMSRDFTQGYGPEEYALRRRVPGPYRVQGHFFGSRQQRLQGPVTMQATIYLDWGRPTERREALTVRLAEQRDWIDLGRVALAAKADAK